MQPLGPTRVGVAIGDKGAVFVGNEVCHGGYRASEIARLWRDQTSGSTNGSVGSARAPLVRPPISGQGDHKPTKPGEQSAAREIPCACL
jgi:hypothetical protein